MFLNDTSDRIPVTERKNNIKMATWNVRTLTDLGKLENIKQEMKRMEINILGLCEMRWLGAGSLISEDVSIIYSGGDQQRNGIGIILDQKRARSVKGFWSISDRVLLVKLEGQPININIIQVYAPTSESTEEEIQKFYNDLNTAMRQCKHHEVNIVMGDLNAKVGEEQDTDVTGKFGLGRRNERGEMLVDWARNNNMIIGNTWCHQHPRRLWTWKSPDNKTRNQIDYIMINKRFKNSLRSVKT